MTRTRRRYRRKGTKKKRRRTRKRKGGEPTIIQKIVRGKVLKGKIDDCEKKLKRMRKTVNQFRAESTANLTIERENVDHVLKQADGLAVDITKILAITEKHYKQGNKVSQLVQELSENKLY